MKGFSMGMKTSEKGLVHQFTPTIYPRKLWVIKGGSVKNIQDAFTDVDGEEINFVIDTGKEPSAMTLKVIHKESKYYGVLVWLLESKVSVGAVAHESVHVASCIFDDLGMTIGFDGGKDEHFAYLVGFAADCINQVRTNKFRE